MDTIDPLHKQAVVNITTPKSTNVTTAFALGRPVTLEKVDILFAPGHVALTGVRINYQGVAILPWNQPTLFVVGDSERLVFELGMYVSGGLSIVTHNGDTQPHQHMLTFHYMEYIERNSLQALPTPPLVTL